MLRQSELITTKKGSIHGELIHYGGLQLRVRCGAIGITPKCTSEDARGFELTRNTLRTHQETQR